MKLAVTATGDNLDSNLARHFGYCKYFIIVDSESFEYEAVQNFNEGRPIEAGIKAVEVLEKMDVDSVATENLVPKAFDALTDAGINLLTGSSGKVRDVVEEYKEGKLRQMNKPPKRAENNDQL